VRVRPPPPAFSEKGFVIVPVLVEVETYVTVDIL
jgi:hypothetical protein